jgi:hypothetical protein
MFGDLSWVKCFIGHGEDFRIVLLLSDEKLAEVNGSCDG